MSRSQLLVGSISMAVLLCVSGASASTEPRNACSVLTLAEVRAIVGTQVDVFAPASNAPKTNGATTISNCTYTLLTPNARSARLVLMWGPSEKLAENNQFYIKRHKELSMIKGDVLVLASVTEVTAAGLNYDQPASQLLMAAALKKL